MTRARGGAPEWLMRAGLGLAIATVIAGVGLGSLLWLRGRTTGGSSGTPSSGPPSTGVLLDGAPGAALPTLEDLRASSLVELSDASGPLYRLRTSGTVSRTLRHYGLPEYPNAVGVQQLDPEVGESEQSAESAESEAYDTGSVATLVTTDDPETVRSWYREHLDGWSVMESPDFGVLFRQEPGRRRTVSIVGLAEMGLVLVEYGVIPESEAAPIITDPTAARKAENCWRLRLALEQFREDTGKDAESMDQLLAESGEDGYQGPYLGAGLSDPYTGKPYEVKDGKVVGPGDVTGYSY